MNQQIQHHVYIAAAARIPVFAPKIQSHPCPTLVTCNPGVQFRQKVLAEVEEYGVEAFRLSHKQGSSRCSGHIHQFLGLFSRSGQGLFYKDGDMPFQEEFRVIVVGRCRGGYDSEIHTRELFTHRRSART